MIVKIKLVFLCTMSMLTSAWVSVKFRTVFLGDEVEAKKLHNELKLDFKSGYKGFNSELIKLLDDHY